MCVLGKCIKLTNVSRCFIYCAGHGGSRAAEYLKDHLFENLSKHPQFMEDTKVAISAFLFLCLLCAFMCIFMLIRTDYFF